MNEDHKERLKTLGARLTVQTTGITTKATPEGTVIPVGTPVYKAEVSRAGTTLGKGEGSTKAEAYESAISAAESKSKK